MFEPSVTVTVYADPDYHYAATASDDSFTLVYLEGNPRALERDLSFASAEEMEAVAKAMLKAVKAFRES